MRLRAFAWESQASANDTVPGGSELDESMYVSIELQEDMKGSVDFCSGAVEMSFDSSFEARLTIIPGLPGVPMGEPLEVITNLVRSLRHFFCF